MTRPVHHVRRRRISTLLGTLALAFFSACDYPDIGVVSGSTGEAVGTTPAPSSPTSAPVTGATDGAIEQLRPTVVARYPHDTDAFTQGLELDGGVLLESTGLRGRSSLREVDVSTGEIIRSTTVEESLFAEGLTVVGDRIIQLTWQSGVAIAYDRATLTEETRYAFGGEGWGLCHDGDRLIMSDGSATLTFRDPTTFIETGRVTVTRDGVPLVDINELECVGAAVYANVWKSSEIVRIDPASGEVTAIIDASALYSPTGVHDVLNGIAHDPATGEFLITGKLWPEMFRVRFEG